MEAEALHDFKSTDPDELGFHRGEMLKILNMEEDVNWFKAESEGKEGFVPVNYIKKKPHKWFVPRVNRTEAENLLLENTDGHHVQPDGAFLVRKSETTQGEFSLSVKFGSDVQHFKVLRDGTGKYFLWIVKFDSMNQLVDYHRTSSVSRTYTIFLVDMVRPASWDLWRQLFTAQEGHDLMYPPPAKVIARYDFTGENAEEMNLRRGDVIAVLENTDVNWWKGQITRDGMIQQGLFPITYTAPLDS